jgi:glycosyltransferase involved in cell wall biosynthesis
VESPHIVINGKFLRAGPTGVHRVGHELLRAIGAIDAADRLPVEALVPPGDAAFIASPPVPVREVGRLPGQLWEQVDLPRAARGRTILSLCNLAPVATRNAVTMIHDAQVFITPESYSRTFRTWYRFVLRAAGRRHRRILTVSHFSKAQLVDHGIAPADRIAVIHNGVDHILRVAADRGIVAHLGLQPRGYAVALANTQQHKNIGLLLAAFARPEMADLKLVLVGGATRPDFEALGHVVPANVVFAGKASDAALRGLIEQALCLAFPSLTEGFGLPPVEAMLLGCPAVIAPCGALPEVCGDAAMVADPHDPSAWSAALRTLHADPAVWTAWSEAGQRHAALFTWDRAARQLLAVLADVSRVS